MSASPTPLFPPPSHTCTFEELQDFCPCFESINKDIKFHDTLLQKCLECLMVIYDQCFEPR